MKVGKLIFKSLNIEGRQSIAGDLSDEEARGIYAYEFTDGTWYVGKSIDVRKRHHQHMHEYRHMDPPLEPKNMLWAVVQGDDQKLDYVESDVIAWFEKQGYSLRNVMKTGRPKGNIEVVVDTGIGWGVPIPWDRKNLPPSTRKFTYEKNEGLKAKFKALQKRDEYPQLIRILRNYVRKAIPAPADSAGTLWIATALPSTNGNNRLCCISCNNVETLVVLKGERTGSDESWCFINVKKPEDGELPQWENKEGPENENGPVYKRLPGSTTLYFDNLNEAEQLLVNSTMLDCCYRANAELMRRGPAMFSKYNNPYLVEAILSNEPVKPPKDSSTARTKSPPSTTTKNISKAKTAKTQTSKQSTKQAVSQENNRPEPRELKDILGDLAYWVLDRIAKRLSK